MDKPCKVLHIVLTHGGGVEVYTRMLIEHTYQRFETVLICAPEYNKQILPAGSCITYDVDVPREISLPADNRAARVIRQIIKKEQPDVLYCHSSMAGAIGSIAALGVGCKILYNPHGWSFDMSISKKKKFFYRMLEKLLAKRTDKIVTISEYEKKIALTNKVCKENKLQVILNGINLEKSRADKAERAAFGYGGHEFIIGCSARLSEQKDPLLFAEVAGRIAEKCPRARFIWVGDGDLRDAFIAALKKNNVFEKTMMTGWVDRPCKYISLFDVAVLFSKWEGFGLCLAEYLALGKPVVATNVGAVSEIVQDGICGRLVNDRDPKRLSDQILSYASAENLSGVGQQCIKISGNFDFKITADQTIKLIAGLSGGEVRR